MADHFLFRLVYKEGASRTDARLPQDEKTLRQIAKGVSLLPSKLKLVAPDKEQTTSLSTKASPSRFQRAPIAIRFLKEHPERGEASHFEEAMEIDSCLGELIVLSDPLISWAERALAKTLAEISAQTGRIERAIDQLDKDPKNAALTSAFRIADLERSRMDKTQAQSRARAKDHLDSAEEAAQLEKEQETNALILKKLKGVTPEKLLVTPPTRLKKKGE